LVAVSTGRRNTLVFLERWSEPYEVSSPRIFNRQTEVRDMGQMATWGVDEVDWVNATAVPVCIPKSVTRSRARLIRTSMRVVIGGCPSFQGSNFGASRSNGRGSRYDLRIKEHLFHLQVMKSNLVDPWIGDRCDDFIFVHYFPERTPGYDQRACDWRTHGCQTRVYNRIRTHPGDLFPNNNLHSKNNDGQADEKPKNEHNRP
jgi:hypothetical protein